MDFKQALDRWLGRHQTGPNRLLHSLGIPATIVGVVLLFRQLWWLAGVCLVAGYVLQVIGHYLEGSRVGEVILLKKIFLPSGGFVRRLWITSLWVVVLLGGGFLAQTLVGRCVYFNFYEVIGPGMYRSGQVPAEHLEELIQRRGIKTVVNLRGESENPWFASEQQVLLDNEVDFISLRLTASRYPSPEELNGLLGIIEKIKPPFLVHCYGGSDRTGFFFVLLALREGQDWEQAMGQLSLLRFGHCGWTRFASITYPLYDFVDYADKQDLPKDLEQFRLWLKSDDALQARQRRLERNEPN